MFGLELCAVSSMLDSGTPLVRRAFVNFGSTSTCDLRFSISSPLGSENVSDFLGSSLVEDPEDLWKEWVVLIGGCRYTLGL